MKNIFNVEDFDFRGCFSVLQYQIRAKTIAQKTIEKLIESWPVVYGENLVDESLWSTRHDKNHDCCLARLAFIEELPKKGCEHEPIQTRGGHQFIYNCKHCGAKLKATWSVDE